MVAMNGGMVRGGRDFCFLTGEVSEEGVAEWCGVFSNKGWVDDLVCKVLREKSYLCHHK